MKTLFLALLASTAVFAASADVDVYSPQELQGMSQTLASRKADFASTPLKKYGNHYTMLANREATGSAEVHEKEADLFVAVHGNAIIVTGGKLVNSRTEAAGELRGSSIEGGQRHELPEGSIIHIPAGVPHQLQVTKGSQFTYFVMKVIE